MSWYATDIIQNEIGFFFCYDVITPRAQSETVDHGILGYVPIVGADLPNEDHYSCPFATFDKTEKPAESMKTKNVHSEKGSPY